MTNLIILVFCGSVFAGKTRSMASICTTKTCKKCDAHVNAASGTQATLQKIGTKGGAYGLFGLWYF